MTADRGCPLVGEAADSSQVYHMMRWLGPSNGPASGGAEGRARWPAARSSHCIEVISAFLRQYFTKHRPYCILLQLLTVCVNAVNAAALHPPTVAGSA